MAPGRLAALAWQMLRALMAVVACLSLANCASVTVQGDDGTVTVKNHYGVLAIDVEGQETSRLISVNGFGVAMTGRELAIGYYRVEQARLGPDCRLVLWVQTDAQLTTLRDLIGTRRDICALQGVGGSGAGDNMRGIKR